MTSHRPAPAGHPRSGTTGGPGGAGLRRTPRLELRHPANPRELARMRALIEDWAREVGLTADELVDLQLAVGEAAANGVEHAYRGRPPGPVEIDLELRDRGSPGAAVVVRVLDHGFWRPTPVEAGPRGRGLSLIRTLSDGLDVSPTGGGTEVSFEIPVAVRRRPAPRQERFANRSTGYASDMAGPTHDDRRPHRVRAWVSAGTVPVLLAAAVLVFLAGYPAFSVVLAVLAVFGVADSLYMARRRGRSPES